LCSNINDLHSYYAGLFFNARMIKRIILFSSVALLNFPVAGIAQGCCSGGSGSPIAGGGSQGVLLDRQMEVSSTYQYNYTNKFFAGNKDTIPLFNHLVSDYLYTKIAYGVTKDLTVSLESGFFLKKQQIGKNLDTAQSVGFSDLIFFPKYVVYSNTQEKRRVEFVLGAGWKIPIGSYNDSMVTFRDTVNGIVYYTAAPPSSQLTTGSHDFIFYSFFFRGFPKSNFRLFANSVYIKKGWNPLGEKFGDYASLGLFAGKTFFDKLGVTLQVKGEYIGKLKSAKNVDLLAFYNVDTASTGSRAIFITPQISYSIKALTIFALSDFPIYQYVNKEQIASQYQFAIGLAYRFFTTKSIIPKDGAAVFACEMDCPGGQSSKPGTCRMCGMQMNKKEKK